MSSGPIILFKSFPSVVAVLSPSRTLPLYLNWMKVFPAISTWECSDVQVGRAIFRISHCRYQPIRLQSNWSIVKPIPNFHSVTSSSCWGCSGLVCTISIRGVRSDFRRQLMKFYVVGQEKLPKTSERKIPQSTI